MSKLVNQFFLKYLNNSTIFYLSINFVNYKNNLLPKLKTYFNYTNQSIIFEIQFLQYIKFANILSFLYI